MESVDYVRWVLQTTNHITYGKLSRGCSNAAALYAPKVSGQTLSGETLSAWGLICYLWRRFLIERRAALFTLKLTVLHSRHHFTPVCLYLRVSVEPRWSCKCPRLHDMTTTRRRKWDKHVVGLCLFNMLMEKHIDEWNGWMTMETRCFTSQKMFIDRHRQVQDKRRGARPLFFYSPAPSSSCTPWPWAGSAAIGFCYSWKSSEWSPEAALWRHRWPGWRRRERRTFQLILPEE